MSFHPDITALEPFVPHPYTQIQDMRVFPPGALPEIAYTRLCKQFDEVVDVEVQRIVYRHAGLNITGILAMPKDRSKARGLVLYNRGGTGNFGMLNVRTVITQLIPLARAGYLVAASNYRGNDGGDGQDEFGGRDVDDVMYLHTLMQNHPQADQKPCYVVGHSRGGMMTYLLIKRGLSMRAAIVLAGVADLEASAKERPEMREHVYKRFIPQFEANEAAALHARSAVYWPEALNVPLLLMHGTGDERVSYMQSERLALLLKDRNMLCELRLYERDNHALIRNWDDVLARTLQWMERHA